MKKIIIITAFLLGFTALNAQSYTLIAQRYEWLAGIFRALGLPAGDGPAAFQPGQRVRAGAVYYDSTGIDSGLYVYSGLAWKKQGEGGFFSPDQVSAGPTVHDGGRFPFFLNMVESFYVRAPDATDAGSGAIRIDSITAIMQAVRDVNHRAGYQAFKDGDEKWMTKIDASDSVQIQYPAHIVSIADSANWYMMVQRKNASGTLGKAFWPVGGGGGPGGISEVIAGFGLLNINDSTVAVDTADADLKDWVALYGGGGLIQHVGADFVVTSDSLKNNNWVNVVDLGADSTGVSNSLPYFLSAIATGKNVFVPAGIFLITGTAGATPLMNLNNGQKMFGVGRVSNIKTTSGARILALNYNNEVSGIRFTGDNSKATTEEFQTGIYMGNNDTSNIVHNCWFENFGGNANENGGGVVVNATASGATSGNIITNNFFNNCHYGITLASRGEYVRISGNILSNNKVSIYNGAGNTTVINNTSMWSDTAYKIFGGTNNAHAASGFNSWNHNTYNLVIDGVTNGYTLSSDMFYAGNIIIRNSTGIRLNNSDVSSATVTLTNNTNLYRSGRWLTVTKNLVSGEDFTIFGETKTGAGAITVFDLLNASDTAKIRGITILSGLAGNGTGVVGVNNDGQLSYSAGGNNTDDSAYHRMSQVDDTTVVFHSNVANDTLSIRSGSGGGGGSGAIGQPYLITHTSGTTWTTPSDITTATRFKVTMVGGGGGGGGNNTSNAKSGAGGGGGALIVYITGLSPSQGYTMAIGAAGTGGDATPNNGTAGSNTTLTIGATTYNANGGGPGLANSTGGAGGTATNGDINITGQSGGTPPGTASGAVAGTAGGNSGLGLGMGGASKLGSGAAATGYGGGGGGGTSTGASGGNGTQGIIIIEYSK